MDEDLKKEILDSADLRRMYEIVLELTEEISTMHSLLAKAETQVERVKWRGRIAVYNALLDVAHKRTDEVRALEADARYKEWMLNRQFRAAAKTVLKKETYHRIYELSLLNYRQFKELKPGLRDDKLE